MDLFVFTFKDGSGNTVEQMAPTKTAAKNRVKLTGLNLGGGVFRYVSHRPVNKGERAKLASDAQRRDEQARMSTIKLLGRRKAFGRNDRCPCGSGKKVKHCCVRKKEQRAEPSPKTEGS